MNTLPVGLTIAQLVFADDTVIDVPSNAIIVVTGPNDSGKSTLLEEINRQFRHYARSTSTGLILSGLIKGIYGTSDELINFLKTRDYYNERDDDYDLPYSRTYKQKTIEDAWNKGDLPTALEDIFVAKLEPKDRLGRERYSRRWGGASSSEILWDNEEEEIRISKIFKRAFGLDLILNRTRGGGEFKVGERKGLPSHKKRLTKEFSRFMSKLNDVAAQGDGMRSFTAIALDLLTAKKSITIIDEPELFLHPPQIRHLARLICEETPENAQVVLATHSDEFIKGVLNSANDRVIVMRLKRSSSSHSVAVMSADVIEHLWQDPLFRTSNALSALFHDVAILVEGESDVRFLQFGLAAMYQEQHLPDLAFFSCNGKGKIKIIASALRKLNVPVGCVVDLDILSNPSEALALYETFGGKSDDIKEKISIIGKSISANKNQTSGRQFKSELDIITDDIEAGKVVSKSKLDIIAELIK